MTFKETEFKFTYFLVINGKPLFDSSDKAKVVEKYHFYRAFCKSRSYSMGIRVLCEEYFEDELLRIGSGITRNSALLTCLQSKYL